MRILVINGPNLDVLGAREPQVYGTMSLWDIENRLKQRYARVTFEFYQSNSEGGMIDALHKAMDGSVTGVVLNPGAYAHYSYAVRDAVSSLKVPVVEVHLSNVYAREEFRRQSVIAPVCKGVIAGFAVRGYEMAIDYLLQQD